MLRSIALVLAIVIMAGVIIGAVVLLFGQPQPVQTFG